MSNNNNCVYHTTAASPGRSEDNKIIGKCIQSNCACPNTTYRQAYNTNKKKNIIAPFPSYTPPWVSIIPACGSFYNGFEP